MSRSAASSIRPILSTSRLSTTSIPSSSSSTPLPHRSFSSTPRKQTGQPLYYNPWTSKTHLLPSPTVPPPLPAIYPQKIVLSDGSTFTSYTTAPSPSFIRLTRDVTNNPLWAPGTEKRGLGDGLEGRLGRFRRRYEGVPALKTGEDEDIAAVEEGDGGEGEAMRQAAEEGVEAQEGDLKFEESDFEWMSEGAKEEKAPPEKVVRKPAGKGGKRK